MAKIEGVTDFISKVCMASNFISTDKNVKKYLEDARSRGDIVLDSEGKEAQKIYKSLSVSFSDEEIKGMATLLNNLDRDFEKQIFDEVYKTE